MSRRSVRATPRGFETGFAIRDSSDVVSLRRLLPFRGSISFMSIFQQLTFGVCRRRQSYATVWPTSSGALLNVTQHINVRWAKQPDSV